MNTLHLSDRELEYLRWQLLRDRPWQPRDDDGDMILVFKAKIIRASGEVPTTRKASAIWNAIKAVSNG
jgi:hypothetical protein